MDTETAGKLRALEDAVVAAETDGALVEALNALAVELMTSDLRRAQSLAERAHHLASGSGDRGGTGRSLHHLGYCAYRLGDLGKAHALMAQALEMGREIGDRLLEADCLHTTGILHLAAPDHAAALDHHLRALALYEALDAGAGVAQTLNDIGNVHFVFDDHSRALSYYIGALKGREANGDAKGVACSFNNIGIVYGALGDREQSLSYALRCLEATRRTGYARLEARCLANMADAYRDLGRFEEALATVRDGFEFSRRHGYQDNECNALAAWGGIHKAMGQHGHALPHLQEALVLARTLGDQSCECAVLVSLGEAALGLDDVTSAGQAFSQAAALGQAVGLKQDTFNALRGLSQTREREGAYAEALDHYKSFQALEKQVFNESADRRAKALMLQMDLENAQKETALQRQGAQLHQQDAELHRLKNVELAQSNAALEAANRRLQEQAEQLQSQAEELRAQADELERQAATDGLTGLHNRRSLEHSLARRFADAKCSGTSLTVVMVDIDHFKGINDRFGHQTGDEVLMAVAHLLRRACRAGDFVARYGGEEFVLVLPETGAEQGLELCERVRQAVEGNAWGAVHPCLSVTVSLGLCHDLSAVNHERLLRLADAQLYQAKRLGRNRVCAD